MPEPAARRGGLGDRAGLVAALLLAVGLGTIGWVRHQNFWSAGFDLGIFDQAAWQLAHGRTEVTIIDRSVFADHVSAVMILFGGLYRLVATPLWLVGVQALAIGVSVIPARALARDAGAQPALATLLVVVSAPLLSAAMFDFHPSTLAVPFLMALCLFARRDQPRWAVVAAIGVVVCRADLGWVVAATAVAAGRRSRRWIAAVGITGLAVAGLLPPLLGNADTWDGFYAGLGDGPLDALLHPLDVLGALLSANSIGIAGLWLLSTGLLAVFGGRWLAAAGLAAVPVLLSSWEGTHLPWYHHGAPLAPLLVAGALHGATAAALRRRFLPAARRVLVASCLALALLLASPLSPGADHAVRVWNVVRPLQGDPSAAVAAVGAGETAAVSNRLAPHLSHRSGLTVFPIPFAPAYELIPRGLHPVFDEADRASVDVVVVLEVELESVALEGFEVVARPNGFVVLRRIDR